MSHIEKIGRSVWRCSGFAAKIEVRIFFPGAFLMHHFFKKVFSITFILASMLLFQNCSSDLNSLQDSQGATSLESNTEIDEALNNEDTEAENPTDPDTNIDVVDTETPPPADNSEAERRRSLLESPWKFGFGRNATGAGMNGAVYTVTNTNDSGPGSLRLGLSQAGNWVRYDPSLDGQSILINSTLRVAANITWDGRDALVRIMPSPGQTNLTMIRFDQSNAIVHRISYGLAQRDQVSGGANHNGIRVAKGENYWFDHIESSNLQDDSFGIGDNSSTGAINVTVTHYKVYNAGKGLLIIQDMAAPQAAGRIGRVMIAYSDFSASCRNFRMSGGNYAHGFNNYIHDFGGGTCGNSAAHGSAPNRTGMGIPVIVVESSVYDDNSTGLIGDTVDVRTNPPFVSQGYVFTDGNNMFLRAGTQNNFVIDPGDNTPTPVNRPVIPYPYPKLPTNQVQAYVVQNAGVNGANIPFLPQ